MIFSKFKSVWVDLSAVFFALSVIFYNSQRTFNKVLF
ncbi:MAG: hypothetical protein MRERC_2c050 [Mycoplasmataceae bacterium RC_NB112A]|nr:MAG: hypothetical protein MRERC_2c050 [Mycoplasmataceae bacterium RC_NB112A]